MIRVFNTLAGAKRKINKNQKKYFVFHFMNVS